MPSTRSLTIAAAQIESVLGDVSTNLARHEEAIDQARAQGADVLLFPETSLVGHAAGRFALETAMRPDDALIMRLARASGPMCAVFGLVEEDDACRFYNSAAVVKDGGLLHVHRKINLATYGKLEDGKHFAHGEGVCVFRLAPGFAASVLICADLWDPSLVHLAMVQGATVLLAPVSSALEAVGRGFDNPAGWEINLRFHALTYGAPIAMANRVGREDDLTFWGGSRILDPFGQDLARAGDGAEMLCAVVDPAWTREARYRLPTVRDASLDRLVREVRRIEAGRNAAAPMLEAGSATPTRPR